MLSTARKTDLSLTGIGYIDFLKLISATLSPNSYFEIGTQTGLSVKQFMCASVCVDPHFKINCEFIQNKPSLFLFQETSDEFFKKYQLKTFLPAGPDVAFLDGMHRFEYLLRDFYNTEAQSHGRSSILIHDCLPDSEVMTPRFSPSELSWTGDVWKLLPILSKYRPDLRVIYLDCPPTGLVACTKLDPNNTVLRDKYFEIIDEYVNTASDRSSLEQVRTLFPMLDTRYLASNPSDLTLIF